MSKLLVCAALTALAATAQVRLITLPSKSPLVSMRFVFTIGSAADPAAKPGLAALTANVIAQGGTKTMTYQQLLDAFFPMAASVNVQVDKEMTTFSAVVHSDNLEAFYKIFRSMLLEPGWREDDFRRHKDDAINFLRVTLRGNNDEELGKEVLYGTIYKGTPYEHHSVGTVSGLNAITVEDLKQFHATQYTQTNLMVGIGGGYSPEFLMRLKADFKKLPDGKALPRRVNAPPVPDASRVVIVEKDTRSVAYSIGFPIPVKRGDPDYAALLVMQSYFGPHRNSAGRLYNQMREIRGLNYGDYAYIEYFPRGMFQFEPDPNIARRSQIFQLWIRPVEPPNAHFALRLAMFELDKLVKQGISQEDFERTRDFVRKNTNLLMKTKSAELGYKLDSLWYDTAEYREYLDAELKKLTRDRVNAAIRKHLRSDKLWVVAITKDAAGLKEKLVNETPSPMSYNAPKPNEILAEDKIVAELKLGLKNIEIVPVAKIFE